jgi:hypothetical protein
LLAGGMQRFGQNASQDQSPKPSAPAAIGDPPAPAADQDQALLPKDFQPASVLHAAEQQVPKARFYVMDVHNHVNDAARIDEPCLLGACSPATSILTIGKSRAGTLENLWNGIA